MLLMKETWKDVVGFEGSYQVSDKGNVRSLRLLNPTLSCNTGYPVVTLGTAGNHKRFHVHSLVAMCFLGPRELGMEVNHINGKRDDNRLENLEYLTHKQNVHHAFKIGNSKHYFNDEQMDKIAAMFFVDGRSNTDVAKSFLPKKHSIQELCQMRKKVRSVIEIWRASSRPKGHRNPYERKLTPEKVVKMKELREAGATQTELAKIFNCHPAHVSRVLAGHMWSAK